MNLITNRIHYTSKSYWHSIREWLINKRLIKRDLEIHNDYDYGGGM